MILKSKQPFTHCCIKTKIIWEKTTAVYHITASLEISETKNVHMFVSYLGNMWDPSQCYRVCAPL